MTTEREVVKAVIKGDRAGYQGLFDRHGALFREVLLRFRGGAGAEYAEELASILRETVEMLRRGEFDDIIETFYNWIVRVVWTRYMARDLSGQEGDHAGPQEIWAFTDPNLAAELPEAIRSKAAAHLEGCALCRDLLEKCKEIPVEVSHAGAPYPREFQLTLDRTLVQLLARP